MYTGIVLAGGQSSRMGQNKALLRVGQETLIEQIVRTLLSVCDHCIVVANQLEGYPVLQQVTYIADRYQQCGPLGGIEAGLSAATTDYAAIVACDMPGISAGFIRRCFAAAVTEDADVAGAPGQPLQAVYRREVCLKKARWCLQQGQFSLQNFWNGLRIKEVSWPRADIFINLNTPEDLGQYLKKSGDYST